MDPSKLSRLRAIVAPRTVQPNGDVVRQPTEAVGGSGGGAADVESVLGGEWHRRDGFSCFVVERRYAPDAVYGREPLRAVAARLVDASAAAAVVMGGAALSRSPFVFFDLETTGLSGGAGTYAFLVGCGAFDDSGAFLTRQFVLLRRADERQLLQAVAAELARAGVLVTFNGKSFDAPLIETRYLYHRLAWGAGALPHLDVLHPARRFWGDGTGDGSCSLAALENLVLGARRTGDVSGLEIPDRYFNFVRTGEARPLAAVLEHNRLDLVSLAGLTARLLHLVRQGPDGAAHPREAHALGLVYERAGRSGEALAAFEHAVHMAETHQAATQSTMAITIAALRALAAALRRARRFDAAAARWRQLLDVQGCPPRIAREASEALAIHHEHRLRDLSSAKSFALRSLEGGTHPGWTALVQHRLARIDKKLNYGRAGRSLLS